MKNKHYVVLPTGIHEDDGFKVVCLMHDVTAPGLKRVEAIALADSLNLRSCREQQ